MAVLMRAAGVQAVVQVNRTESIEPDDLVELVEHAVEVTGDVFTVQGLESSFADGLDDWVVLKFLMKIERKLGYDSRNA